ncbi:MAG: PEP-CTERM sorting domain-containing protein, partial [Gammaproteobacteria bacterium]|nr:PEP-CTERM sorting domain-containing protein [Gammaproteobacteria bacterium]
RTVPAPGIPLASDELYILFSGEVVQQPGCAIGAFCAFNLIPTTVAGLTINDLTGLALDPGALGAVYSDIGNDLITDNMSAGTNDFLTQALSTTLGTFELSAGLDPATDDEWVFSLFGADTVIAAPGGLAGLSNSTLSSGLSGTGANGFGAGLSVLDNMSGVTFVEEAQFSSTTAGMHDIVVSNGGVSGACDLYDDNGDATCDPIGFAGAPGTANPMFGTINGLNYYGLSNNADFSFTTQVPEPHGIALLGLGLLGLAGMRRRKS